MFRSFLLYHVLIFGKINFQKDLLSFTTKTIHNSIHCNKIFTFINQQNNNLNQQITQTCGFRPISATVTTQKYGSFDP